MKQFFYFTKRDEHGWEQGNGSFLRMQHGKKELRCEIKMDMDEVGDGKLWIMQWCTMICAEYSEREISRKRRMDKSEFVEDGEIVEIIVFNKDNLEEYTQKQYRVHISGDYSDAGYFEEIA